MVGRYMHVFPLALIATIAGQDAVSQPLQAQSIGPKIICGYDPSTGIPNPLGMRTFITLTETGGTTEVRYEQLGSMVPGPVESILTAERTLTFPNQSVDRVRQLLVADNSYYRELIGFTDPDGFAPVNSSLVCRAEAVANRPVARPRPAATAELPDLGGTTPRTALPDLSSNAPRAELPDLSGNPPPQNAPRPPVNTPSTFYGTIAGLANGNYRYVSGPADNRGYSDQELLSRGGVLFVFRKTGDEIIGSYSYVDGESICVRGRVSGNTVSGQAYPFNGVAQDLDEGFQSWGPAPFLRVRRTLGEEGNQYYGSATLELNDFSKINAGSSLPPSSCD
ncbi:MAG: hypothetical protein KTR27_12070 [Leptolyngbyaceae cyanobacterium MAG.088]|nr:hypothetical protein [Leptolyngbyaceae cyanobacterium MAG.088]